jgi:RNA polymerase sigma factor (sigma-70 family)
MSPWLSDVFLRSQSDERLVTLVAAGHERAFGAIVERYRPELQALAHRLSSDGKGEDILQQAFLSAFAALRSGSQVSHLRGWLYRIVRNAAANAHRSRELPLEDLAATGETLEDLVAQRALALTALSEVARLPSRQRDALVGTALEGLSRGEIATSMEISEGAVRQLVHRARLTLRSAVTAVTPWPLARWAAASGPGTSAAGELAASAGALPGAGLIVKIGAVITTGALASGVVTMSPQAAHPHASSKQAATTLARTSRHAAQRGVTAAVASVTAPALFIAAPSSSPSSSRPKASSTSARSGPGPPPAVAPSTGARRTPGTDGGPRGGPGPGGAASGEHGGDSGSSHGGDSGAPVTDSGSGTGDATAPATGVQDSGSNRPGPEASASAPSGSSGSSHDGEPVTSTGSGDSSPSGTGSRSGQDASIASDGGGGGSDPGLAVDSSHGGDLGGN